MPNLDCISYQGFCTNKKILYLFCREFNTLYFYDNCYFSRQSRKINLLNLFPTFFKNPPLNFFKPRFKFFLTHFSSPIQKNPIEPPNLKFIFFGGFSDCTVMLIAGIIKETLTKMLYVTVKNTCADIRDGVICNI